MTVAETPGQGGSRAGETAAGTPAAQQEEARRRIRPVAEPANGTKPAPQPSKWRRRLIWLLVVLALAAAGYFGWRELRPAGLPPGIASGNGRTEATEIDIAAKIAGRINDIMVNEGDFVTAGQPLAVMDTQVLNAQLLEAQAQLQRALVSIDIARDQITQRQAEKEAATATVAQRQVELDNAKKRVDRTDQLVRKGNAPVQQQDDDRARVDGAQAALSAALAQAAAADAAIGTAKSQQIAAQADVEAARATIQRIQADITDSTLLAPRDGRVQYRIAQPGEVLAAGGKVLNMVDLSDVYMTFFLPTESAGRVSIGSEVHLVLDAIPDYVIPASASFVADVAQFTPKTVETQTEREKLMFRVKAQIDPALLRKYIRSVKTGLPGMAYVRTDPSVAWPPELQVKLPNDAGRN